MSTVSDGGERARPVIGPGPRPNVPTRGWTFRTLLAVASCVCLFFIGFGGVTAWQSLITLPRTYDRLRTAGQHATARLVRCAHRGCTLELGFGGRRREWLYAQDKHQFAGLAPGAPVDVLVDPRRPTTVYTTVDVTRNTNAGWSGLTIFSLVLLTIGLIGLYGLIRLVLLARRTYRRS